jgi:hypothetical protein
MAQRPFRCDTRSRTRRASTEEGHLRVEQAAGVQHVHVLGRAVLSPVWQGKAAFDPFNPGQEWM